MGFHIVTSIRFDFDMFVKRANQDKGPRHNIYLISEFLHAKIHQPNNQSSNFINKALSLLAAQPEHWELASQLSEELTDDDVVYCVAEDIGLPLAILCKFKSKKPRLVMGVMAPSRKRTQYLIKSLGLGNIIQVFAVNAKNKADYLQTLLNLPQERVILIPEKTDEAFFNPAKGNIPKTRPLIASAGLEQRDYKTLAEAIHGEDINVKICAFSPNASAKTQVSMPEPVPDNMEIRYFEFTELRDLYRSADIVVVSLLENDYSAGLTVLMEAMACRRPVIMTKNVCLAEELVDNGLVIGTKPGDILGMRTAIQELLSNPEKASALAQKAYDYFLIHHTSEYYVNFMSDIMKEMVPDKASSKKNYSLR